MPQKRSTAKTRKAPANAAPPLKRNPQKKGAQGGKGGMRKGVAHFVSKRSTTRDIVGAVLLVLAVALIVLVLVPTSAPVAFWIHFALSFAFGVGAILLPLALLAYAISLFFQASSSVSGRFALGLICMVSAVLGLITLLGTPLGMAGPSFTYLTSGYFAQAHGGAWGGLLAWALLSTVGPAISLVIFIGLIVVGFVVCGFSISGFVSKMREKHAANKEARQASEAFGATGFFKSRKKYAQEGFGIPKGKNAREVAAAAAAASMAEQMTVLNRAGKTRKMDGTKTTFIGERKTSVLKRNRENLGTLEDGSTPATSLQTSLPAEKTYHPELESFEEPTGAISYDTETQGVPLDEGVSSIDAAKTEIEFAAEEAALSSLEPAENAATTGKANKKRKGTKRSDEEGTSFEGLQNPAGSLEQTGALPTNSDGASRSEKAQGVSRNEKAKTSNASAKKADIEEQVSLPPLGLLQSNPKSGISTANEKDLQKTAERLQATLEEFGLRARVKGWVSGPLVTTFKIEMGEGERVNKITNLEDDIALALAATSVRIFAPIPGTSLVGIEIPNAKRSNVCLGDVLPYAEGGPLELAVGRDSEGHPHIVDLAKLPHLLVAGTTGSGKSVMLNAAIMSILMRATSDEVRFIMVDPKRVEFTCYTGLPHLYVPVVNEPKQAASALQWAVSEMERRLRIFEKASARDISAYNALVNRGKLGEEVEKMPYFVIVIDELADLMMVAGKEVESSIVRIAQLGRAAGIHLIVATQRPSADVVTGLIKANIDNRVALSVDNGTNSRIIIDQNGAEKLLGNGDMLIKLRGRNTPQRIQGCYVSDPEIEKAVSFISDQKEAEYHDEILTAVYPTGPLAPGMGGGEVAEEDPLLWDAAEIVAKSRLGSTSGLQRTLRVGYARAGRIIDMLEAKGIVGPPDGSKPREVLVTLEELEEMRSPQESFEEVY